MNSFLSVLKELIMREISAYEKLILLSKQKKEAVIKNNFSDVDDIITKEQAVITKIKSLERQRDDVTNKIAYELKAEKGSVRLGEIIDIAQGETKQEFISLREKLEKIIFELSRLNALNKALINTHLKYSSFCIEVVSGYLNALTTYTNSGKANDNEKSNYSLLDRTV